MAMTSQNAVERALRQLINRNLIREDDGDMMVRTRTVLAVVSNDALELMAKRVATSPGYEGLQKDFTVTPVAGFLDLTAQAGMLFDIKRSRVRVGASHATVRAIDSYETLEHGNLPTDQVYFAQDGAGLRFRALDGTINSYATELKIRTNYIPSFTDAALPLPDQYRAALVSTMVELAIGQLTESPELAATGPAA